MNIKLYVILICISLSSCSLCNRINPAQKTFDPWKKKELITLEPSIYSIINIEERTEENFIYFFYTHSYINLSDEKGELYYLFQEIDFHSKLIDIDNRIYDEIKINSKVKITLMELPPDIFLRKVTFAGDHNIISYDENNNPTFWLKNGVFQETVYYSPNIITIYSSETKRLHHFIIKGFIK